MCMFRGLGAASTGESGVDSEGKTCRKRVENIVLLVLAPNTKCRTSGKQRQKDQKVSLVKSPSLSPLLSLPHRRDSINTCSSAFGKPIAAGCQHTSIHQILFFVCEKVCPASPGLSRRCTTKKTHPFKKR